MSQLSAILLGTGICCVIPLISLMAGMYIGKYGLPVAVRWRGLRRPIDSDEPAE